MIFTFSSVFILLLCTLLYQPQNISMDSAISFPATILPHQATGVWPESDGIWRREFFSMGALVSGMNSFQIHTYRRNKDTLFDSSFYYAIIVILKPANNCWGEMERKESRKEEFFCWISRVINLDTKI